jgi:DNA end-binding protein Ku
MRESGQISHTVSEFQGSFIASRHSTANGLREQRRGANRHAGHRLEGLSELRSRIVPGSVILSRATGGYTFSSAAQEGSVASQTGLVLCREDELVERSEIVKGYETKKGEYVTVEDEELKKIAPTTATTMEVLQFVSIDDVDPLLFESSYYLAPEEKVSKPYALFWAALTETKRHAIAKIAMHNREHVVLIRPAHGGLVLHTLYYEDELHKGNKADVPKTKFSPKELDMAKTLVQHLTAKFKLEEFHDTYRENVGRLIEEKSKGEKITTVKQPRKAPVIDLMEALRKSLQSTSRPAASHQPAKTRTAAKKLTRKRKAA